MTKETLGYVRLEWTCPNCGSKNPGPQKTCGGCGAPQPEHVEFQQAAQEELITDEAEIARAKAGPDIHCAYCGARNPAGAETCVQCGANLAEGRARESGRVLGAHRDEPAPEVPCPSCGALNPATALECSQCGATMARPEPKPRPVTRRAAAASQSGCGRIGVFILVGVVLLGALLFFLTSRTKDVVGRVENLSWTRTVAIEAFGPVTYEDWRDDIPSDGVVGSCEQRVHHTQDEPAPNAEKVCGTPYTVDQGSGFGQVVQDCEYQVYEAWCEYTVNEWQAADAVVLEGSGFEARWPDPQLASDQREGEREESYKVVFDADGERHTYRTSDYAEFTKYEVGSRWKLKVNALGGVTVVEPAE